MLMPPADSAEDRDVAGIASEGRDVLLHPLVAAADLVAQAWRRRPLRRARAPILEVQEAERAEPVVQGDVARHRRAGQRDAVVEGLRAEPITKPPPCIHTITGRAAAAAAAGVDVEIQQSSSCSPTSSPASQREGSLGRARNRSRGPCAPPSRRFALGPRQSAAADGGLRIGDAAEHAHAFDLASLDLLLRALDDRRHSRSSPSSIARGPAAATWPG